MRRPHHSFNMKVLVGVPINKEGQAQGGAFKNQFSVWESIGSVIGKLSESYWTNGSEQPSYPILSNRVTARKLAVTTASFLTVTYVSHTCINTYTLK